MRPNAAGRGGNGEESCVQEEEGPDLFLSAYFKLAWPVLYPCPGLESAVSHIIEGERQSYPSFLHTRRMSHKSDYMYNETFPLDSVGRLEANLMTIDDKIERVCVCACVC